MEQKMYYTAQEIAQMLGISQGKAYKILARHQPGEGIQDSPGNECTVEKQRLSHDSRKDSYRVFPGEVVWR